MAGCDRLNTCVKIAIYLAGEERHTGTMNTSFFGELLHSIAERGRALVARTTGRTAPKAVTKSLVDDCEALLSGRGEASGTARAGEIISLYDGLTIGPRIAFFEALAEHFGPNRAELEAAIAVWKRQ